MICIGSSAAALSCATQLRRLNKTVKITILTAQSQSPNNVCLLAEYVAGKRTRQSMFLPIPENIDMHLACQITRLDATKKVVVTKSGHEYRYDKLFIGTGLQPRIPELFIPYLYKKVFPFKSLDDIIHFEKLQIRGKNVLVVGGGVTGIEAACALTTRGYQVTLVEKNKQLLPQFDQTIGAKVCKVLQGQGITLFTEYKVSDNALKIFDLIFLAAGSKPTTNFLKNQVLLQDDFVVVDTNQKTSVDDIFAGGDVCLGRTLWPQALRDGFVGAHSMLNLPVPLLHRPAAKMIVKVYDKTFFL